MMQFYYFLSRQLLIVTITSFFITQQSYAETCSSAQFHADNLSASIPCMTFQGEQYAITLNSVGDDKWTLDPNVEPSFCEWSKDSCVTVADDLRLTIPSIIIGGQENRAEFIYDSEDNDLFTPLTWIYQEHSVSRAARPGEGSTSYGTLANFIQPTPKDGGNQKTLLMLYMVGSDLEGMSEGRRQHAGTRDFKEMEKAYNSQGFDKSKFDMIIAFGGAGVDGWHGVKYATLEQVIADGQEDFIYGNSNNYLYAEKNAHMGDQSTLTHFLKYVKAGYQNYNQHILFMWDHGASFQGFGHDVDFGSDPLQLPEISNSLKSSGIGKLDLIGFDACLMASMEVAKTVHPHASYLLGSEETEPGHGWNWEHVLKTAATTSDITIFGKSLIDNFVQDKSHEYIIVDGDHKGQTDGLFNQKGKTLALLDLGQYANVQSKLDAFAQVITPKIANQDTAVIDAFKHAGSKARAYGVDEKGTSEYGHDLKHFIDLFIGRYESNEAKALQEAINTFVIHSGEDGTRSGSFGVFINSLNKKPTIEKGYVWQSPRIKNIEGWTINYTSDAVWKLQDAWGKHLSSDTTPPKVVSNTIVQANTVDDLDTRIQNVLKNNVSYNQFNPEQQKQIVESIKQEVQGLSGDELTNKLNSYVNVEFTFVESDDPPKRNAVHTAYNTPFIFAGERRAFIKQSKQSLRSGLTSETDAKGILAKFDDPHLTEVVTYFGNLITAPLEQEDGSMKDVTSFYLVSELLAEPTANAGEYFTPEWNQNWYTMTYDADSDTEWLPLLYQGSYAKDGKRYTEYTAEVDYIPQGGEAGTYKDEKGNPVNYAILTLTMDEENQVVDNKIATYKILYKGPDDNEGYTLFDKASHKLEVGDRLRFYNLVIDLSDGHSFHNSSAFWEPSGNLITLTQEPTFGIEKLLFEDGDGNLLDYYYSMKAEDASGNVTLVEPHKVSQ
ncbi:clostripain-related cysteine peptidase [Candidatus Albibeggiatoa sp. nov. NOAA]|uniref:clostripain-related cysteine peptidase n=1 Tax=Candidatus Albibeggiatoa sp. nov. NOAA TaxID=3162724 RepID=UPI0032FDC879|nr:clostripain-related cysteine peptidase [Thiotrichaceae bacterium]